MTELEKKIRKLFSKPTLCVLATVTAKGKPWARYVTGTMGEDMTLRFSTFAQSRKVRQIRKNPEVHLVAGVSSPRTANRYVQIEGRAEVTRARAERHAFWTEGLLGYFQGPDDPNYAVVVVRPYRIEYQGMDSPTPEVWSG